MKLEQNWRVFSMDELWELLHEDVKESKTLLKPNFPTRRWGDITTKTASTNKKSIEKGIQLLKERSVKVRKRV